MLEIVILAAGGSSRLGKSKQLLTIGDEPLIVKAARTACELADYFHLTQPTVVVGKDRLDIEKHLTNWGVTSIYNAQWKMGMGLSLATAVQNMGTKTSAVLLMTCDQVLLNSDTLKPLIKLWQSQPEHIIASSYNGVIGIPVIFPERYFSELIYLKSDKGAREILQKYHKDVMHFDLPLAAQDLDTLADEVVIRGIIEGGNS